MFGVEEVVLICVIVLVVFGPDKLPDVARVLGRLTREFNKVTYTARRTWDEIGREMELQEAQEKARQSEPQQPAEAATAATEKKAEGDGLVDLQVEAGDPKETENIRDEEGPVVERQDAAASVGDAVAGDKR